MSTEQFKQWASVSCADQAARLSRPSLSFQYPLPDDDGAISSKASMSYPSDTADRGFMLTPNLTLLPSFGSAYVGETFSCSLCANNELLPDKKLGAGSTNQPDRIVTSIHVFAEMQTPSQLIPLDLLAAELPTKGDAESTKDYSAGKRNASSLQRILDFDLKEEGNHVLAVSVSYTETFLSQPVSKSRESHGQKAPFDDPYNMHGQSPYSPYGNVSALVGQSTSLAPATGSRVRTFRKLYQFATQPCLSVRTKTTELASEKLEDPRMSVGNITRERRLLRFALEAQVENVGDGPMLLEKIELLPKPPFTCKSLNWNLGADVGERGVESNAFNSPYTGPILAARDIYQLAFLIEQDPEQNDDSDSVNASTGLVDGRTSLELPWERNAYSVISVARAVMPSWDMSRGRENTWHIIWRNVATHNEAVKHSLSHAMGIRFERISNAFNGNKDETMIP
ncbi:hypothetical protein KEM54_005507 [Ascosphaera aggregata]|nr:hypothetical protein KEM54_005507 [Ascosphaera aggregata]